MNAVPTKKTYDGIDESLSSATIENTLDYSLNSGESFKNMLPAGEELAEQLGSSQKTSSNYGKPKRHVHFSEIEIRNYPMILGDNPSVSYGPPVCLAWKYDSVDRVSVDFYENNRGKRRTLFQMNLNYHSRMQILEKGEYTKEDIKEVRKCVTRTKIKREITKSFLIFYHFEMSLESACRKLRRFKKFLR